MQLGNGHKKQGTLVPLQQHELQEEKKVLQ
jgi:hypothetical protein